MISQAVWFNERFCRYCKQVAQFRITEAVTSDKKRIIVTATCQSCGRSEGHVA